MGQLERGKTWEAWRETMMQDGTWADEFVLSAFVWHFDIPLAARPQPALLVTTVDPCVVSQGHHGALALPVQRHAAFRHIFE